MRRLSRVFSIVVLVAVTLAARQTPLIPSAAGAQAFQDVPREQTVIFENIDGRVPVPDNMNPYVQGLNQDWGLWQANQESLFYLNLETGKLIPWQASGYSFNSDYTELTINLRPGVKWQDGVDFTADDVVFTLNMLKNNDRLQYSADMKQWLADATARDPHTVVIKLTAPNPRFVLTYLSVQIWHSIFIVPKHIWENQDPVTFKNFDLAKGWPIGTGPYKLVGSTETQTVFDLLPTWWAATTGLHAMPVPKRAIWVGVSDENTRAAMAASDQLDAMWILEPSSFTTAQRQNPNIVAWTNSLPYAYLDACPRDLKLNTAIAPFNDPDVRWALNYAINRNEIATIAFQGVTDPSESLFPTYPPLKAFLERNKALFDKYPVTKFDLSKTDQIMTSKGYKKDSDGLWVGPDGKRLTFTIIGFSGETDQVKMGPVIVNELRKGGFDVSFQPLERSVGNDQISRGVAVAWLGGTCAGVTDPYLAFSFYHSRWVAPVGQPSSGPASTSSRWSNSDFDKLVDKMAVTPADDPAFEPLADQALAIWTQNLPSIPLVQAYLLTPFNKTHWTNWPTSDNNYIQPDHWWTTGDQILINLKPAK